MTENDYELLRTAWNSLKIAIATALLTTAIGLPAAYVLARRRGVISPARARLDPLSQMFPLILIIIPLFLLLRDLELTDTHAGLVLVYIVWALPFILWMLHELRPGDPARPRGGGARRRRLAASRSCAGSSRRCSCPGIVVTTLFAFILAWNEFFFALVMLQTPELTTLPLRLAQFVGIEGVVRLGPLAAAALARHAAEPRPLHDHPALADARPPLRGGQGLAVAFSRAPRRRMGRRQRRRKADHR